MIAAKPAIALCFAIAGASMGGNNYVTTADEPVAEATAEPAAGDCPGADPAATTACDDDAAAGGGFIDAATSTPIEEESSAELAPTVGAMLAGTALMLLAAFAPSMILKFFTAADATAGAGGASALANMGRTGRDDRGRRGDRRGGCGGRCRRWVDRQGWRIGAAQPAEAVAAATRWRVGSAQGRRLIPGDDRGDARLPARPARPGVASAR